MRRSRKARRRWPHRTALRRFGLGSTDRAVDTVARRRLLGWITIVVVVLALGLMWTVTPLGRFLRPTYAVAALDAFGAHPWAHWILLGGFVLGGLLAVPVTVMIVLTVAIFGAAEGAFWSLLGVTFSGALNFTIGRSLGHGYVAQVAGSRIRTVSLKLRDGGVVAIAALRMMPITHFTVVSLVAGASHVRLRDFLAGTILGMAPGTAAVALFFDRLSAATRDPSWEHAAFLVGVSLAILAVLLWLRRLARDA